MKLVTKGRLNLLLEFVLYSVLYTGIFLLVEIPFKSFGCVSVEEDTYDIWWIFRKKRFGSSG